MAREDYTHRITSDGPVALTKAEIDAMVAKEEAFAAERADYLANHKYKNDRAKGTFDHNNQLVTPGYKSVEDQLDMQYHDAVDGTTTWIDYVAAVKAAHPKKTD